MSHHRRAPFAFKVATACLSLLSGMTVLQAASWAGVLFIVSAEPEAVAPQRDEPPALDVGAAIALPASASEKLHSTDDAVRRQGVDELLAEVSWPEDHRGAFLTAVAPAALESAIVSCSPPSVTVAQAIQESGWGRSTLARKHGNLFGVKASKGGVVMGTREVERGASKWRKARFASFADWEESVAHHGALLSGDPRYAAAREQWDDWSRYLRALAPVYATDQAYVRRVSRLVNDYELARWDEVIGSAARKHAGCGASS